MDAHELRKKKRMTELSILSEIKTNIRLLESMSGLRVTNIELTKVDVTQMGSRPKYELTDVEITMEL